MAACTNQLDVVDYLLNNPHQKARLQEQDTQGNTVLHALVMIADDTEENTKFVSTTYVEILKAGVKLDPTCKLEEIVNYDGLNPLQLAAKTGKVEVGTAEGMPRGRDGGIGTLSVRWGLGLEHLHPSRGDAAAP